MGYILTPRYIPYIVLCNMNSFPSYVPIKTGVVNSYLINCLRAELAIQMCVRHWTTPFFGVGPAHAKLLECSVSYLELRQLKLKYAWQLTPRLLQIIHGRLHKPELSSVNMFA